MKRAQHLGPTREATIKRFLMKAETAKRPGPHDEVRAGAGPLSAARPRVALGPRVPPPPGKGPQPCRRSQAPLGASLAVGCFRVKAGAGAPLGAWGAGPRRGGRPVARASVRSKVRAALPSRVGSHAPRGPGSAAAVRTALQTRPPFYFYFSTGPRTQVALHFPSPPIRLGDGRWACGVEMGRWVRGGRLLRARTS